MKKTNQKILLIFSVLIILINTTVPVVNGVQVITIANLLNDHKIKTHIKQENENGWFEVICNYICYKIDGEKYPAYCIEPGIHGVDEEGDYTVTVDKLLNDKLIYNTILNGYPYKTPTQLGVESADDAYVATKLALKSVLMGRDVKEHYKPLDAKGEKIINAMDNIAAKGKIGNEINKEATISASKVGDLTEYGDYYYQEYGVYANVNISSYTIKGLEGFSNNYFITDTDGKKKSEFNSNQNFRIMIPKSDLNQNISGKIKISAECKTNPIFYGEAPNEKIQDYAITYKPYVEYNGEVIFEEDTNTASIKVIKKDKETNEAISGVSFGLYKENGEYISTIKTDSNGIAMFNNLYQGTYKIKELLANENYINDDTEYHIKAEYNKQSTKTITNIHKKGNLKIIKVDKDDNNLVLEGIEFDLFDASNNKVAHLITDVNGEAVIQNINIGKYTLKETKTNERYNLCIDSNIEVKWNETSEIKIENEKKKGQIKIIKQDKEKNEIKLEGVKFQIIDSDNTIVDNIKTDFKGEGISSRLPIGEYKVKELSLGKNNQYILNQEEYILKVEDEKVSQLIVENMHKKGNLKIIKVDKDNPDITLGAIEFDLIDENGNIIEHLITDVNGEASLENINTGIYTLKETKTKREYNLCENKDIVVEWDKTSEVIIQNEKKKGQIKIIKEDEQKGEIKLSGVKFQILNKRDELVEEIKTNENGEAISSKLLIGEYKIKEIDLGNNNNYLLNDEIYTVQVNDNQTTPIIIKNYHKKGSLKIVKVDKDDHNISLDGVEFEVEDKDGFIYKAITNNNGVAEINDIRIGNIKIKEISTNKEYVLSKEVFESQIKYNEISEIVIENEKKKGQVEIYKYDKDNRNLGISDVEFVIVDKLSNIVDKLETNKEGYAISKRLPIGEYYIKETKTNSRYVLNENVIKINIEENKVLKINIENEKIKGRIKVIKTSSNDSPILNIKQGEYLENVEFDIFNNKGELVDRITTDNKGEAISKELDIGRYKVIEKSTNEYYLLNNKEFFVNIKENNEIKILEIQNEAVIPKLDIQKIGQQFAEKNEEIKYEFEIKNQSNTELENFTWVEYIPYEKSQVTKMVTGIYNQELEYEIYYKTNKNDYVLLKKANTCKSEYLSFDNLNLLKNEIITQIKVEYKTVSKDFKAIINPVIFTKIKNNVKKDQKIINVTELFGNVKEYEVRDKSIFETVIIEKEIIKKLPKTGY